MKHQILLTKKNGAILGWMIGDALGTTLEFQSKETAIKTIKNNNYFVDGLIGQGVFDLAPGQFTDDTEMGLALMEMMDRFGEYNQDETAKYYHRWYCSGPFDIGNTTRNTVCHQTAEKMIEASKKFNSASLSNGFLMRLPGFIACYSSKTNGKKLLEAVKLDVVLTHAHPEAISIAIIYTVILHSAVNDLNVQEILNKVKNLCKHSPLISSIYQAVKNNSNTFDYESQTYFFDDIDKKCIGFVGYSIWLLLLSITKFNNYLDAIFFVVSKGGDTDTNACIVGAVMAALYPSTVPVKWVKSVVKCKTTRHQEYPIANPENWIRYLSH